MVEQRRSEDLPNHDRNADFDELPVSSLRLRPFFLARHELTFSQWSRLASSALPSVPGPWDKDNQSERPFTLPQSPVDWVAVKSTLPFVPATVADMIQFQWHTAARSGSVVNATADQFEVDPQNPKLLLWRPKHKTEHLGTELIIPIGPKCQRVLRRYLSGGPLFDPSRDPMARGNVGQVYSPASYRRAIVRGIEKAERAGVSVPKWSPHAIRHARGHEIRRSHGIEAVQAILGHASLNASEIYSERRLNTAREIAAAIG